MYLRDEEPRIYARASSNTYNWQFSPLREGGSVSRLDFSFFLKVSFLLQDSFKYGWVQGWRGVYDEHHLTRCPYEIPFLNSPYEVPFTASPHGQQMPEVTFQRE